MNSIYEPPKESTSDGIQVDIHDGDLNGVDEIASKLGLERV